MQVLIRQMDVRARPMSAAPRVLLARLLRFDSIRPASDRREEIAVGESEARMLKAANPRGCVQTWIRSVSADERVIECAK